MNKNPRLPIWLSAFGFPGLGQFVQKRWFAGLLFSAGFMTGFIWILLLAIHNIIELYSMAFDEAMADPQPVPLSAFGQPLLLVGIIYLLSLFDVFLAQQHINTKQHEEEFLKTHDPADL
ncbi:hypothetical protein [Pontiella agarivorans]|uniref:DUF5683 domain-containing protein n=1 Tax=Pontiella agarivorans TaxID=3038953 RepID=A0ABU5MTG2_9BACT|nr:hypothetical protein [Pontiella agarivorans]MDZ8117403.1 hypothetical protein [Pontiella agarivorans]